MDLHQLHRLQYSSPEDLRKDITHPDIDTHNLRCIKFLTDEIPDPSKIYVFRSRRFVCQKIEAEVVDGYVSQIKTWYELGKPRAFLTRTHSCLKRFTAICSLPGRICLPKR